MAPLDERTVLETRLAEIQAKRDAAQEEKERLVTRQERAEDTIETLDFYKTAILERLAALP
jgi:hypothetical protein